MLIDTHTHLYLDEFQPDVCLAVDRAKAAGVGMMILPNVDSSTVTQMKRLHKSRGDVTAMAMGLHPTEVGDDPEKEIEPFMNLLSETPGDFVAVGEIGMDLYWDKSKLESQKTAFRLQCEEAVRLDLPVIIHCREALNETLDVPRSLKKVPAGVFHSFGGTADDVVRICETGDFYFGINGIVTFKNSRLKDVLPSIRADRLLLKTDSPYLAPVPFRGKRNESAFIRHTAAYVANILDMRLEDLEDLTTGNAKRLFRL